MSIPLDKNLYDKIKKITKKKFKVWPSAYASGWLVREYKKNGGKYKKTTVSYPRKSPKKSPKKSPRKSTKKSTKRKSTKKSTKRKSTKRKSTRKSTKKSTKRKSTKRKNISDLSRWFQEEWIDVCKLPDIVPCGRKNLHTSSRKYPYCRPLHKISSRSPRTVKSLTSHELSRRCRSKRKSPYKKVYGTKK